MYRYYSTLRPITIGAYPKTDCDREIVNFDKPTYCEDIGRTAWGYIEYSKPITQKQADDYDLVCENNLN